MNKTFRVILVILVLWLTPAICDAVFRPVGIIKGLLSQSASTVFSSDYDITTPAGSDSPTQADDRMREIKAAVQERENVDHYWPLSASNKVNDEATGEHRKITFTESLSDDPTQVTGKGHLYMRLGDLWYQDASNTSIRITRDSDLNSSGGLTVDGTTTLSSATTGTILSLSGAMNPTLYSTGNGGFIDEDSMATNSNTKVASQQSIKAYVDGVADNVNIGGVDELQGNSTQLTTSYVLKETFTETFNSEKNIIFFISGGYNCDNSQTISIQLTDGTYNQEWTFGGNDSDSTEINKYSFALAVKVPRASVTGSSQTFNVNAKASGTTGNGCRLGNVAMFYLQVE